MMAEEPLPPIGRDLESQVRHYRAAATVLERWADLWRADATDLRRERATCAEEARDIAADSLAYAQELLGEKGRR